MKMYDDPNFFFKTSDLALATALCVLGIAIEAMQQSDGERMNFIFAKSDRVQDSLPIGNPCANFKPLGPLVR